MGQESDIADEANEYFCPGIFNDIAKYMYLVPFLSGMIINKLNLKRDTNAIVETWMRFLKYTILKNKVSSLKCFILKPIKFSAPRFNFSAGIIT